MSKRGRHVAPRRRGRVIAAVAVGAVLVVGAGAAAVTLVRGDVLPITSPAHAADAPPSITPASSSASAPEVSMSAVTASSEPAPSGSETLDESTRGPVTNSAPFAVRVPADTFPPGPSAVEEVPEATIEHISLDLWHEMEGVSWESGCPVGRADLRLVTVPYIGFGGHTHAGQIVVNASIAETVRDLFLQLYDIKYPIHRMHLVETYGPGEVLGADDYASMADDNTSGFNCRYVVGREGEKVLSPHAYGTAVDINPWENPDVSRGGVFPNEKWLDRDLKSDALLTKDSDVVQAFVNSGATWGGSWWYPDYHHFEWH